MWGRACSLEVAEGLLQQPFLDCMEAVLLPTGFNEGFNDTPKYLFVEYSVHHHLKSSLGQVEAFCPSF